jgi:hypothetical protein
MPRVAPRYGDVLFFFFEEMARLLIYQRKTPLGG